MMRATSGFVSTCMLAVFMLALTFATIVVHAQTEAAKENTKPCETTTVTEGGKATTKQTGDCSKETVEEGKAECPKANYQSATGGAVTCYSDTKNCQQKNHKACSSDEMQKIIKGDGSTPTQGASGSQSGSAPPLSEQAKAAQDARDKAQQDLQKAQEDYANRGIGSKIQDAVGGESEAAKNLREAQAKYDAAQKGYADQLNQDRLKQAAGAQNSGIVDPTKDATGVKGLPGSPSGTTPQPSCGAGGAICNTGGTRPPSELTVSKDVSEFPETDLPNNSDANPRFNFANDLGGNPASTFSNSLGPSYGAWTAPYSSPSSMNGGFGQSPTGLGGVPNAINQSGGGLVTSPWVDSEGFTSALTGQSFGGLGGGLPSVAGDPFTGTGYALNAGQGLQNWYGPNATFGRGWSDQASPYRLAELGTAVPEYAGLPGAQSGSIPRDRTLPVLLNTYDALEKGRIPADRAPLYADYIRDTIRTESAPGGALTDAKILDRPNTWTGVTQELFNDVKRFVRGETDAPTLAEIWDKTLKNAGVAWNAGLRQTGDDVFGKGWLTQSSPQQNANRGIADSTSAAPRGTQSGKSADQAFGKPGEMASNANRGIADKASAGKAGTQSGDTYTNVEAIKNAKDALMKARADLASAVTKAETESSWWRPFNAENAKAVNDAQRRVDELEGRLAELRRPVFGLDANTKVPGQGLSPEEQRFGTQSSPNPMLAYRSNNRGNLLNEVNATERAYRVAAERAGLIKSVQGVGEKGGISGRTLERVPMSEKDRAAAEQSIAAERVAYEKAVGKYNANETAIAQLRADAKEKAGVTNSTTANANSDRAARLTDAGNRSAVLIDPKNVLTGTRWQRGMVAKLGGDPNLTVTPEGVKDVLATAYARHDANMEALARCTTGCESLQAAIRQTDDYIQQLESGKYTSPELTDALVRRSYQLSGDPESVAFQEVWRDASTNQLNNAWNRLSAAVFGTDLMGNPAPDAFGSRFANGIAGVGNLVAGGAFQVTATAVGLEDMRGDLDTLFGPDSKAFGIVPIEGGANGYANIRNFNLATSALTPIFTPKFLSPGQAAKITQALGVTGRRFAGDLSNLPSVPPSTLMTPPPLPSERMVSGMSEAGRAAESSRAAPSAAVSREVSSVPRVSPGQAVAEAPRVIFSPSPDAVTSASRGVTSGARRASDAYAVTPFRSADGSFPLIAPDIGRAINEGRIIAGKITPEGQVVRAAGGMALFPDVPGVQGTVLRAPEAGAGSGGSAYGLPTVGRSTPPILEVPSYRSQIARAIAEPPAVPETALDDIFGEPPRALTDKGVSRAVSGVPGDQPLGWFDRLGTRLVGALDDTPATPPRADIPESVSPQGTLAEALPRILRGDTPASSVPEAGTAGRESTLLGGLTIREREPTWLGKIINERFNIPPARWYYNAAGNPIAPVEDASRVPSGYRSLRQTIGGSIWFQGVALGLKTVSDIVIPGSSLLHSADVGIDVGRGLDTAVSRGMQIAGQMPIIRPTAFINDVLNLSPQLREYSATAFHKVQEIAGITKSQAGGVSRRGLPVEDAVTKYGNQKHTGVASYYGGAEDSIAGSRDLSSGAIRDDDLLHAAHKELPLGTVVEVQRTTLAGAPVGDSIAVVVNSRGPFVAGRDLDLSVAAADALKMRDVGTSPITYKVIAWPDQATADSYVRGRKDYLSGFTEAQSRSIARGEETVTGTTPAGDISTGSIRKDQPTPLPEKAPTKIAPQASILHSIAGQMPIIRPTAFINDVLNLSPQLREYSATAFRNVQKFAGITPSVAEPLTVKTLPSLPEVTGAMKVRYLDNNGTLPESLVRDARSSSGGYPKTDHYAWPKESEQAARHATCVAINDCWGMKWSGVIGTYEARPELFNVIPVHDGVPDIAAFKPEKINIIPADTPYAVFPSLADGAAMVNVKLSYQDAYKGCAIYGCVQPNWVKVDKLNKGAASSENYVKRGNLSVKTTVNPANPADRALITTGIGRAEYTNFDQYGIVHPATGKPIRDAADLITDDVLRDAFAKNGLFDVKTADEWYATAKATTPTPPTATPPSPSVPRPPTIFEQAERALTDLAAELEAAGRTPRMEISFGPKDGPGAVDEIHAANVAKDIVKRYPDATAVEWAARLKAAGSNNLESTKAFQEIRRQTAKYLAGHDLTAEANTRELANADRYIDLETKYLNGTLKRPTTIEEIARQTGMWQPPPALGVRFIYTGEGEWLPIGKYTPVEFWLWHQTEGSKGAAIASINDPKPSIPWFHNQTAGTPYVIDGSVIVVRGNDNMRGAHFRKNFVKDHSELNITHDNTSGSEITGNPPDRLDAAFDADTKRSVAFLTRIKQVRDGLTPDRFIAHDNTLGVSGYVEGGQAKEISDAIGFRPGTDDGKKVLVATADSPAAPGGLKAVDPTSPEGIMVAEGKATPPLEASPPPQIETASLPRGSQPSEEGLVKELIHETPTQKVDLITTAEGKLYFEVTQKPPDVDIVAPKGTIVRETLPNEHLADASPEIIKMKDVTPTGEVKARDVAPDGVQKVILDLTKPMLDKIIIASGKATKGISVQQLVREVINGVPTRVVGYITNTGKGIADDARSIVAGAERARAFAKSLVTCVGGASVCDLTLDWRGGFDDFSKLYTRETSEVITGSTQAPRPVSTVLYDPFGPRPRTAREILDDSLGGSADARIQQALDELGGDLPAEIKQLEDAAKIAYERHLERLAAADDVIGEAHAMKYLQNLSDEAVAAKLAEGKPMLMEAYNELALADQYAADMLKVYANRLESIVGTEEGVLALRAEAARMEALAASDALSVADDYMHRIADALKESDIRPTIVAQGADEAAGAGFVPGIEGQLSMPRAPSTLARAADDVAPQPFTSTSRGINPAGEPPPARAGATAVDRPSPVRPDADAPAAKAAPSAKPQSTAPGASARMIAGMSRSTVAADASARMIKGMGRSTAAQPTAGSIQATSRSLSKFAKRAIYSVLGVGAIGTVGAVMNNNDTSIKNGRFEAKCGTPEECKKCFKEKGFDACSGKEIDTGSIEPAPSPDKTTTTPPPPSPGYHGPSSPDTSGSDTSGSSGASGSGSGGGPDIMGMLKGLLSQLQQLLGGQKQPPGTTPPTTVAKPPVAGTVIRFSCDPTTVLNKGITTLSWSCSGNERSTGIGFDTKGIPTGSIQHVISMASSSAQFGVSCASSPARMCTVNILHPVITVTAAPGILSKGETSQINWAAVGVNECAVVGPNGQEIGRGASIGSVETPPLTRSTSFAVICSTDAGQPIYEYAPVMVNGDPNEPVKSPIPYGFMTTKPSMSPSTNNISNTNTTGTQGTQNTTNTNNTTNSNTQSPPPGTYAATDANGNTVYLCDPEVEGIENLDGTYVPNQFTYCLTGGRWNCQGKKECYPSDYKGENLK